ncbi:MAG: GNAT family N-acetyltransferase [Acidobacteria bacterium]|nr:GNAT family N-acetyltransferase [Acidobacteriota bacterium]
MKSRLLYTDTLSAIRHATPADLPRLIELEQVCFESDRFTLKQYRQLIGRRRAEVVVYESAGKVVGSATILLNRRVGGARLYNLNVHPDFQRRGIGKALLRWTVEHAASARCDWVSLEVKVNNPVALSLYKKFGFETIQRLCRFYEDESDAFRMVLSLGDSKESRKRAKCIFENIPAGTIFPI